MRVSLEAPLMGGISAVMENVGEYFSIPENWRGPVPSGWVMGRELKTLEDDAADPE